MFCFLLSDDIIKRVPSNHTQALAVSSLLPHAPFPSSILSYPRDDLRTCSRGLHPNPLHHLKCVFVSRTSLSVLHFGPAVQHDGFRRVSVVNSLLTFRLALKKSRSRVGLRKSLWGSNRGPATGVNYSLPYTRGVCVCCKVLIHARGIVIVYVTTSPMF